MNTRIAPSPTGDMHVGTARTAYFNWLAARATGGSFLLRIDDTDQARNKPEYVDVITDCLKWLGLDWDRMEFQGKRFDRYKEVAATLPTKTLDGGAIALNLDADFLLDFTWTDEIARKDFTVKDESLRSMVLIKSDGSPTYNFCSVVDDIDFDIDCIIRGVDHTTNTSKQAALFRLLKGKLPKFYHVGLICQKNKPLSKRDGVSSILRYRDIDIDSDAMLNFLARLGWGPTVDDKSTMTLPRDKMVEMFFSAGSMRNNPAGLDLNKLESFDRKYKASKKVWRTSEKLTDKLMLT